MQISTNHFLSTAKKSLLASTLLFAVLLFSFSTSLTAQCTNNGGLITLQGGPGDVDTTICIDAGDTGLEVKQIAARFLSGSNFTFVITDADENILAVPMGAGPFDLAGAGVGQCLIYHVSFEDGVEFVVGDNLDNVGGCFDLSNAITVTRQSGEECINCGNNAGMISLNGGSRDTTICIDDAMTSLEVSQDEEDALNGANFTYVITDSEGSILGIPGNNGPFDLAPAGAGACNIYHLSYEDDLSGLEMGENIDDFEGCFDLSAPIVVTRLGGSACANCSNNAGLITLAGGAPRRVDTTICVDAGDTELAVRQIAARFFAGDNFTYVITDANGMILGIPAGNGPFDLAPAGPGACNIYYLSYEDGLTGLEMGENISGFRGCHDFSNPIIVNRQSGEDCINCGNNAGMIALNGGFTDTTICIDDAMTALDVFQMDEDALNGTNLTYVITDDMGNILGIPGDDGPFDLAPAGPGACSIYYLSYEDELTGLVMGENIDNFVGCFDLSNPIVVNRKTGSECASCSNNAGLITLIGGPGDIDTTICIDDENTDLIVRQIASQFFSGSNFTFVITDADGEILGIPAGNGPFDLSGAGVGACNIYYAAFEDDVTNFEVGNNLSEIRGCFDLSNAITVTRLQGTDCPGCDVEAGMIALLSGSTDTILCLDNANTDLNVEQLEGGALNGENQTYVITDDMGNILGIPANNGPFDLSPAGLGTCSIYYLAYNGELDSLVMGANIEDFDGCFVLSNPIIVTRVEGADCPDGTCTAQAGMISLLGGSLDTTICLDSMNTELDVIASGEVSLAPEFVLQYVVTSSTGDILALPMGDGPIDLSSAGVGICLIYRLAVLANDIPALLGATSLDDIQGVCFDVSNPITVTRTEGNDCPENPNACDVEVGTITLLGGSTDTIICLDDDNVELEVVGDLDADVNVEGVTVRYVITSSDGVILSLPADDGPFDLSPAGLGVCGIVRIAYRDEIEGLEMGLTISELQGCIDFSNPIAVTRVEGDNCSDGFQDGIQSAFQSAFSDDTSVNIFPNPTNAELTVTTTNVNSATVDLQVFDQNGRLVISQRNVTANTRNRLDVSQLKSGTYHLRMSSQDTAIIQRFIKVN